VQQHNGHIFSGYLFARKWEPCNAWNEIDV